MTRTNTTPSTRAGVIVQISSSRRIPCTRGGSVASPGHARNRTSAGRANRPGERRVHPAAFRRDAAWTSSSCRLLRQRSVTPSPPRPHGQADRLARAQHQWLEQFRRDGDLELVGHPGGSGIDPAHCTTSTTSSGEGSLTLTATCTDQASSQGTASYQVNVDRRHPASVPRRPRSPTATAGTTRRSPSTSPARSPSTSPARTPPLAWRRARPIRC